VSLSTEQIACNISKALRQAAPISADCSAIVFSSRNSGLANRLRALVAYQALSRLLEKDFYVDWVPNAPCDEAVSTLIDVENFKFLDDKGFNTLQENKNVAVLSKSTWFDIVWLTYLSDRFSWEEYARSVRACLDSLHAASDVTDDAKRFLQRFDVRNLHGLHIRHTDNLGAYPSWQKNAPDFRTERISQIDGFESLIRASSNRFFLSTDDKHVEDRLVTLYPEQLIVYPKIYRKPIAKVRIRTSTIREALIEMVLLGSCRHVTGTYFSSFSVFSAFWGDVPYQEMRGVTATSNDMVNEFKRSARTTSIS
jgi:hypothetical protein